MSKQLPEPVAAYFAGNKNYDVSAMLAPFAESAVVKDEGQERRGLAAIREWIEETNKKYAVKVDVSDVTGTAENTTVRGLVSGTFPGSPVELRYAFTLDGEKIARLEISLKNPIK